MPLFTASATSSFVMTQIIPRYSFLCLTVRIQRTGAAADPGPLE
jgi:hypothetical protein